MDETKLYFLVDNVVSHFEDAPLLKLNKSNKALLDWLIEVGYFNDGTRLVALDDLKTEEF